MPDHKHLSLSDIQIIEKGDRQQFKQERDHQPAQQRSFHDQQRDKTAQDQVSLLALPAGV